MITACKSYITNNDTATIWNQPPDRVMEKLRAAIRLKQVGRAGEKQNIDWDLSVHD